MEVKFKSLFDGWRSGGGYLGPRVAPFMIGHATVGTDWSNSDSERPDYLHHLHFAISGGAVWSWEDGSLELKPGQAYLAPANCVIERSCQTSYEHCSMVFSLLMPDGRELLSDLTEPYVLGAWTTDLKTVLTGAPLSHKGLMLLISEASRLIANGIPDLDERIASLYSLHDKIRETIRAMESQASQNLKIADLAGMSGLSQKSFTRKFIEATGKAPKEYLSWALAKRACAMLAGSSMTVKEIACELKFKDEHYFSRFFAKQCGIPPLAYRKRVRPPRGLGQFSQA